MLTPKGRGTFPILVALRQWSEEFDDHPEEIATILVDREKGRPVKKLEMRAEDGRLLSPADTITAPAPRRRSRCHHTVIASAASNPEFHRSIASLRSQ